MTTEEFKKKIEMMTEQESSDYVRTMEVEPLKDLRKALFVAVNIIDDYIDDINIRSYKYRTKILTIFLQEIGESRFLVSHEETREVRLGYYTPGVAGILENIDQRLHKELDVDPSKIMTSYRIDEANAVITWKWVL